MNELVIYDTDGNARRFAIAADSLLPAGKRAILRSYRATNVSDPGRIRTATWELWGPMGASKESMSGLLATDYVQNLETRFPRRLISKGARNAVTLTSKDPTGVSNSNKLGQFKLGDTANKLGGAVSASSDVTHFVESNGYLFACRGRLVPQVRISDWTVLATSVFPEAVSGATSWYGKARFGLGAAAPMRTLTSASATGAVFEPTSTLLDEDVYAGPLAVGSDRCWFITRGQTGELENLAGYTLDDFQTINNPFQIGDPKVKANGIGPFGPFTFFGTVTNLYSFTDQAKKIPLSRALIGHSSANNGSQFADPGWGWNYAITDIGLRALTSHIDNPVGPGESMRHFTGHGGRPTAIWAERGELFVVYLEGSDSYAYRCTFGALTAQTGQPDFYPWWYKASTTCKAVFSTNTPTNTAIVWAEGTNMAYETISRDGRDDLFSSRTYDTNGGTWHGTELDRDPHLLKILRLARVRAKNMTSGSSWTLAMSFDNGSYLDVGQVTSNGFHALRPVQDPAVAPLDGISGHAIKPRWTQVAAGSGASTSPPELSGPMEVEYDERPKYITEVGVSIQLTGSDQSKQGTIAALEDYMALTTTGPLKVRLPDERTDQWAMVANVTNRRDIKGDGVEAIDVILHLWELA